MFNSESGYSLADIAAATGKGNDDGWGGSGSWIWAIIIIFALFSRNGNGLFGGNGSGVMGYPQPPIIVNSGTPGYSSNANVPVGAYDNYVLATDFAAIENKIDSVNNGLCSGFYQEAQLINGLDRSIANTGNAILTQMNTNATQQMQDSFALQSAINGVNVNNNTNTNALAAQLTALGTQQASCCCDIRQQLATGFGDVAYRMATDSCAVNTNISNVARDITDNQNANTRAILEALQAQAISAKDDKIADLTAQVNALTLAASQQAQNNFIIGALSPTPKPCYTVPSPYATYNTCGGCSCGV